jgi:hypothetical protein
MKPETKSWVPILFVGVVLGAIELGLVSEYQLAHGIRDESTLGGPALAVGTLSLLVFVGALAQRRWRLSVAASVVSLLSLVSAYALLIQW